MDGVLELFDSTTVVVMLSGVVQASELEFGMEPP
jgi:hypothetical protein